MGQLSLVGKSANAETISRPDIYINYCFSLTVIVKRISESFVPFVRQNMQIGTPPRTVENIII